MGSTIKKHPNYLTLENYEFLDELTSEETRTIKEKYAHLNKKPPNRNDNWKGELKDVHPWVQNVYKSLAAIWEGLAIIQDKHSGGHSGSIYADHYLTYQLYKDLYTKKEKEMDWIRCYAFEDKLRLSESALNEAMVQCHRYSRYFFAARENSKHKYISIITDGSNYALWYSYLNEEGHMFGGLTDTMEWSQETLLIVGRVFKTFAQAEIGRLRANASPRELESFFPDKDIANVDSPNTTSTSFTHRHLNINKGLYNVILQWAVKRSQFGLPIVSTSIGEVEAYRILGTGSSSIVFEAYTPENVRVALKYSLDDRCLEREVQMLKKFEKLEGIPKLLYEDLHNPIMSIPCIVTSMVGRKITKVDVTTACNIIADVIEILKALHKYGYIHNDIHPGNIVNINDKYRLIDFGFAVPLPKKRDNVPSSWPEGHIIFASHNRGKCLGAGDDLEALCYTIAFMYNSNNAYWHIVTEDPYQAIRMKERKLTYLFDGLPPVFRDFFDYVYDLDITVIPDYEYWQGLFLETMETWCSRPKKHLPETSLGSSNHNLESERCIRRRIEQQAW